MPNLTNQPSVFDSPVTAKNGSQNNITDHDDIENQDQNQNAKPDVGGGSPTPNGTYIPVRIEPDEPDEDEPKAEAASPALDAARRQPETEQPYALNGAVKTAEFTPPAARAAPLPEPDFLEAIDPVDGSLRPEYAQPFQAGRGAIPPPPYDPANTVGSVDIRSKPATLHPQDVIHQSRSLRMQWRFLHTLVWAAWLFARVIFWQVYVAKLFPDRIERSNIDRWRKYAREYSRFAAQMGGVFIKMGQFISTRVDMIPEIIIKELESLQDEVPQIAFDKIQAVMERELGPIEARYAYFNEAPVAAASLGQAHRARLHNGDKVVVKVQRPGIRELCFTDLAAMRIIAHVAMRFRFISRRCDAPALIEEFGRVFLEELSYTHEAYNARRFAKMFEKDMGVYIPHVYTEHSTDHVLTIEDVTTIKITDYEALEKAGISRKQVAKRLMDTYLRQIFEHYFFHADPHPGNLFVYPLPVEDEKANFGPKGRPFYLIFIDFGMTGTLTREIADGVVNTLSAVISRDVRRLVESYVKLGFILPGSDIERIIEATDKAFDELWGMSMTDMRELDFDRMADVADEFSDLLLAMPFYIPQDFIYLGRTVSIMSGMTTSLDPTFNPWKELQPYTEVLIARGFGINIPKGQFLDGGTLVQGLLNGDSKMILNLGEQFVKRTFSPGAAANEILEKLRSGELHVVADLSNTHRQQLKRLERETRRTSRSVFFGSVLIASTLLFTSGYTVLALLGLGICGLSLLLSAFTD